MNWFTQQDNDNKWIEEHMANYTDAFSGFLNDNAEGVQKNPKAPKYKSNSSGKSTIVALVDIPKGSVIAFAAWGGKNDYGPYVQLKGQLVEAEHMPAQETPKEDFCDDIPF